MKFVSLERKSLQDHNRISVIIGVSQGKSFFLAKQNGESKWILYKNIDPDTIKKENLHKTASLSSLDEVLDHFQSRDIEPLCPKEQLRQAMKQNSAGHSTRMKEKRRYFRKNVNLNGEYQNYRNGTSGDALIENVSFNGVKFVPMRQNGIRVGDRLHLSFTLDAPKKSLIKRDVQIRYVNKNQVGAEFINSPEYDKDLGFYLWICRG